MGSSLSSLTPMHALPRQPPQWKNACLSLFQALIILLQGRFLLPEPFLFPQTHSDVCHHKLKTPCFSYVLCDNNFPPNQRPKPRNVDYYFVMLCFGCSGLLASVGLATRCSASGGCSILTGARATAWPPGSRGHWTFTHAPNCRVPRAAIQETSSGV